MKSILSILAIIFTPFLVHAQQDIQPVDHGLDINELFKVTATAGLLIMVMIFILVITKRIQDFKLKTKIIEKGIPESIALSVLQTNKPKEGNINVKWFAILAGLGAGLTIINFNQPLGLHSVATMIFCLSASFLGYYFFEKKNM